MQKTTRKTENKMSTSTYCYCDSCLSFNRKQLLIEKCEAPKTLDSMLAEQALEQLVADYDETPRCPGYTTEIHVVECGVELEIGEGICEACVRKRRAAEDRLDLSIRKYENSQVDIVDIAIAAAESEDEG